MKRTVLLSAALLGVTCAGLAIPAQEAPTAASAPAQDTSDQSAPETRTGSDARPADVAEPEHGAKGGSADPGSGHGGVGHADSELKVLRLAYADAKLMSTLVTQLFRDVEVAADQRLNAIIVTGSHKDLAIIEALLLRLDKPHPDRTGNPSPDDFLRAMRGKAHKDAPSQPAALREKYFQLEQKAAGVARQYRDLSDEANLGADAAAAMKLQLADTVKQAFEARQELQRAELETLRQRLIGIERQIASRERIKDEIIDRRIEDLLTPEFRWDGTGESRSRPAATGGVTDSQSPQAVTQTGDYTPAYSRAVAQILFGTPQGARVTLPPNRADTTALELPARVNIFKNSSDEPVPFRLSNIPAREGLELGGTIELAPISAQIRAFLQHTVIPIQIHDEDVDQASSGNLVTKVIYLPKPEHQEIALAGVETLVSTRLDPGLNPIVEADRRGYVLATLRLGNRVQEDHSTQPATKPDARAQQLVNVAQTRLKVLSEQHTGGKAELADVLSAANELLEAQLGVAQSAEARRAALRGHISLLKSQRTIAEKKYRGGVATQADVLLTQAALLKAERQLEAETPGAGVQERDVDSPTAQPQSASIAAPSKRIQSNSDWVADMFPETHCDLGDIAPGAKVQHRFVVHNIYVEELHIASVRPTGKQVSVSQVTNPHLKTFEKSQIVVEVEAGQHVGKYQETLTVVFNKPFRVDATLTLNWTVRDLAPVEEEAQPDEAAAEDAATFIWDVVGVKLHPLSRDDLPTDRFRGGMQITGIRKYGPAAEAKLRVDDIIVGIHNWETISVQNVVYILNHSDLQPKQGQPSDVRLYVLRGDETLSATIPLPDPAQTTN